ncbi:MAG TPA: choice-of-anchor L domain-containing protein [Bacteroidia bacterium]|nr:choice-of-anchor L domain-containing protein [Bacteroidia bacterium]
MRTSLPKFTFLLAIVSFFAGTSALRSQIVTTNTLTPTQLVQNVLLGPGIQAFNITYTGYANAIGKFVGGNSGTPGLGIDSGVVMTNGTILANDPTYGSGNGPQGPNNSSGAGVDNGQPGDTYLDGVAGCQTFNACVLEFDFIPMADSVKFNYVFGTDEYMEYVSGGFADVFAFVLSGVTVPLAPTNIALIPSTTTPVTALNVNANVNSQYYVDNENPPGTTVQYDGFTTVLQAKYPVQCGETYHIKLACADALDGIVDGGVFLQAGSFTTGTVNLSTQISYGSTNDSTLYEGCGQACLILSRTGSTSQPDTVDLAIGGTATNGVDIIPQIPNQVIFQPGQDSIVLCVQAQQDGIPEGLETFTLTSNVSGPCVQSVTSLTLYLSDAYNITANAGNDTSLCSSSAVTLYCNATGGIMPYTYSWNTGATTPDITVSPTTTTSYVVTVSDQCGTPVGVDTVNVFLPNTAPFTLTTSPDLLLCNGDAALMTASPSGGSQPYTITWGTLAGADSVPNPSGTINQFTPGGNGTFVVSARDGCGNIANDTITVTLQECAIVPPNVFTPNGDGTNDNLVFHGLDKFPGSSLYVYDRWGTKVYESSDYQNDWNGGGLHDGTYFYILNVAGDKSLTGFVTLLSQK